MSTLINDIRNIDESLKNAKIKDITVHRISRTVDAEVISDKAVSDDIRREVAATIARVLPDGFTLGCVNVSKILADGELVAKSVLEFIDKEYKSAAHSLTLSDIVTITGDGICRYTIKVHDDAYEYFINNRITDAIDLYLADIYCGKFIGDVQTKGKAEIDTDILKVNTDASDFSAVKLRTYTVADPVKLWGEDVDSTAVYMADADVVSGEVTFAGTVTSIMQKETKNGKPFYIYEFTDTTAKIQGKVFLTKEKEKKIEKINVGTQILTRGELSTFNGNPSYIIRDLSFCIFPANFKPVEREGRPVPGEYTLVFPSSIDDLSQSNLFEVEKPVEPCLIGRNFVVVDIETTGLSYISGDKITEIGAVRIKDGKIIDKFQTLINPEQEISEEITSLTGINDEMVKDAPTFDKVISDFYKYCDGYTIVAHNIEFDYKFIKFLASKAGYIFKNKGIDTYALSKETLPRLKNHKLNTVCGYFGIEFLHHRALSDAHATAKMLLKLAEVRKNLPDGE